MFDIRASSGSGISRVRDNNQIRQTFRAKSYPTWSIANLVAG
jgi:hypothetical protein